MYMLPKTQKLYRCRRCGGQVMTSYDGIDCLQCGATYTKEGKLLTDHAKELGLHLLGRKHRSTS